MRICEVIQALYHGTLAKIEISEQSRRLAQYHRARALPSWGMSLSRVGVDSEAVDVSIIIPSFNYAEHLELAMMSAMNAAILNDHLKVEIIIFDDCSTDSSYKTAVRFGSQSKIPFLIIRPFWNVGLSSARNIGLLHARGTYVFFLDADNTMFADGLRNLYACAEERNADAAYGPIRRIALDGHPHGFLSNQPFDEVVLRTLGNYIDAMALFRRSSLLNIGGYDLELLRHIGGHEDHDLWLRLAAAKAKICYCPEAVVGDYLEKMHGMAHSISSREYSDGYQYMQTQIAAGSRQRDDQLVFDLGFHKGEDSAYYLNAGYRVVAVEADPGLYAQGVSWFWESINKGQLTLINAAVVGWRRKQSFDTIQFHPHPTNTLWGTASASYCQRNAHTHGKPHGSEVVVPTISLEQLVTKYGCPYFLKIDIEGMDTEVVNDLERLTTVPAFVSWETGKQDLGKVIASHLRMRRLGYQRFRIVQQKNINEKFQRSGTSQKVPPFSEHSSGPMPDRHPLGWISVTGAITRYILLFGIYRLIGPGSPFWWAERHRSPFVHAIPCRLRNFLESRSIAFPGWFDSHAALSEAFVMRDSAGIRHDKVSD